MRVEFYRTPSGRSPVEDYLKGLPIQEGAEIDAVLESIEQRGLDAPLVSMRQIRGKLWELRISHNRVFYVVLKGDRMVLLHAYRKRGQKAPIREIETALRRLFDVMER